MNNQKDESLPESLKSLCKKDITKLYTQNKYVYVLQVGILAMMDRLILFASTS